MNCAWVLGDISGWATAICELLIAAAILWELEENRRQNFLTEASDKEMYEARGVIFQAFSKVNGSSIEDKSKNFCKGIWENDKLKGQCEEQVRFFSKLGVIHRRAIFRRWSRFYYVSLFPHAAIFLWVMLQPFIEERRKLSGEWWATPFADLTSDCLRFVLRKPGASLTLYDSDRKRKQDLVLSADYLRHLQEELPARRWWKLFG